MNLPFNSQFFPENSWFYKFGFGNPAFFSFFLYRTVLLWQVSVLQRWMRRGITPSRLVPSRRRDGKESSRDETVTIRCEISRFSRLLIIVNFLNIVKSLETSFNLFKNVLTRYYWGKMYSIKCSAEECVSL